MNGSGENRRKTWWRRHLRTAAGIALCGVLAGGYTAYLRAGSVQVMPPVPGQVCPLLRPELVDLVVPGHGVATQETDRRDAELSTWCVVERADQDVSLAVGVINMGRAAGNDPVALARDRFVGSFVLNRERRLLDGLGDEAGYWRELSPTGSVYVTVRVGARLVHVVYRNTMVTPERVLEAAVLAAREVLARL
ncbi:hypothetical protein [Catellatospora citrea]|uniref:Uncharacterized protein n=1 Tax=Catellatospora citrea TaxID=53366 RepID=A0A8J3NWM0_9ACTN|nr:hypothetical protein [Catellatospora citrea]GIF95425.1 hypothetical protein Cci01nite_05190 [Catellatospora citrea]